MYKILVSDKLGQAGIELLESLDGVSYDLKVGLSEEELIAIIGDYHALIIRSATQATRAVIEAGKQLKVIGRAGIGVDNIDIKAATENGVIVMNTPQANSVATAEHTLTMMLAVARHTAPAHASLKAGKWDKSKYTGIQLYRRQLGIIGFGKIARLVAKYAQGFNMNVVAYDPYVSEEVAEELGVKLMSMDALLSSSDFISLHTVVTEETENLMNAEAFAKVKPGAILINSARGKLIDEQALYDALTQGQLAAAAIDVYRTEPATLDNPLIGLENLLHLPHVGASTMEAQRDVATEIVQQIVDALNQTDFRNSLNMPFPVGLDFKRAEPYALLAEKIGTLHAYMADSPIRHLSVEIGGQDTDDYVKPIACGVLKGVLYIIRGGALNFINAPIVAHEHGIKIAQSQSKKKTGFDHLITVTAHYDDGHSRTVSGALFNNKPRIIKISNYVMDMEPSGRMIMMLNHDVPGVIGKVGTLLAEADVNISEWRLGRSEGEAQALAFIGLDQELPQAVFEKILSLDAVIKAKIIDF